MIQVSREDFERLNKVGLIDYSKANKNYTIASKKKKGKRKKYYVVETRGILNFLGLKRKVRNF